MSGRLVLVGTPIGNLGDLSPRAVEALTSADVIACEDTRRTGRLLQLSGIPKRPLTTVNDHTEYDQRDPLLDRVSAGETVVLVSDAGMPGISDPGERLVAAAADRGLLVEVVPGPTAMTSALVLSGLAGARFCFEGFLPRKGKERSERIAVVAAEMRTTVLYEAPHRLVRTLEDLRVAVGGSRRVALARELTKMHEEVFRGTLDEAVVWGAEHEIGEFVIVLDGAEPATPATDDQLVEGLRSELADGRSGRDAVDAVTESFGVARRRVYQLMLAIGSADAG